MRNDDDNEKALLGEPGHQLASRSEDPFMGFLHKMGYWGHPRQMSHKPLQASPDTVYRGALVFKNSLIRRLMG